MKKPRSLEMNRQDGASGGRRASCWACRCSRRSCLARPPAQTATRSPFVLIVVGDNGVVQAGVSLSVSSEPEMFWPTATGTLTTGQHDRGQGDPVDRRARRLRRQAPHRPRHQPSVQLERLLALGGRRPDPHGREDHGGQHQLQGHGHLGRHRHRDGEESSRARPARDARRACSLPAEPASTSPATSPT